MHKGKQVKLVQLRNPWGSFEWKGAWNDKYHAWTKAMRQKYNCYDADDGFFFMTFTDYVTNFSSTTVCYDLSRKTAIQSKKFYSFNYDEEKILPQAFFKFRLTKQVDFKIQSFAISVSQQGNRLGNYRNADESKQYERSAFNIILMKENGTYVQSTFDAKFQTSLFVKTDV